jgi:hypothetical protein
MISLAERIEFVERVLLQEHGEWNRRAHTASMASLRMKSAMQRSGTSQD